MSKLNQYIGAKIRALREAKGWSQEILGELIDMDRVSVTNMESGRHGLNAIKMFTACTVLNCTPNDLFPPIQKGQVKIIERTKNVVKKKKVRTAKLTGVNFAKL